MPGQTTPGRQGHPSVRQPNGGPTWTRTSQRPKHPPRKRRLFHATASIRRSFSRRSAPLPRSRHIAQFRFRAQSQWEGGTQSRTTIAGFYGVGAEMQHDAPFQALADHPKVLCGEDNAPAPVEWVLHALAACLTAGIANISAARGVNLHSVECSVEGDIDLQGILGLSDKVRNGFQAIRVNYTVKGDASEEKLRTDRRSGPRPLGRLRHPDRACPGHDRGRCLSNLASSRRRSHLWLLVVKPWVRRPPASATPEASHALRPSRHHRRRPGRTGDEPLPHAAPHRARRAGARADRRALAQRAVGFAATADAELDDQASRLVVRRRRSRRLHDCARVRPLSRRLCRIVGRTDQGRHNGAVGAVHAIWLPRRDQLVRLGNPRRRHRHGPVRRTQDSRISRSDCPHGCIR